MTVYSCPLCAAVACDRLCELSCASQSRSYFHCRRCDLVFLDPAQRLDVDSELKHYGLHQNRIEDQGYCKFLGQLIDPLLKGVKQNNIEGASGLDFGCGPGPVLAQLVRMQGYPMQVYDPFFADDRKVLDRQYDFITCSEVVEHLYEPGKVFRQLYGLVKSRGWLGIMTGMLESWDGFADWHYHRDVTHVCFYSHRTMAWIAKTFAWQIHLVESNVAIFRKPD